MSSSETVIYKLTVMGGGGVGKSALTLRLITNNFDEEYDPTIEDLYRMVFYIDNQSTTVDILDTAGQDEFSSMQDQWVREGDGFLLVYSITSSATFNEVKQLYEKIKRTKPGKVPIVLVGNKCDLTSRQVSTADGEALAQTWGVPFFETSAKTKTNNEVCFYELVSAMKNNKKDMPKPPKKRMCTIL